MVPALQEMASAAYVRDIDASKRFYGLLGFCEQSSGKAESSAWSALHNGTCSVLLASTRPPLVLPRLPLLFYFYFDDLDAAIEQARAGGVEVTHMGYPPHAQGGEAKMADPDGNTVLVGQRERSASQPRSAADDASPHFSLLREAAAAAASRGGTTIVCQVTDIDGKPCGQPAGVKLADPAGDALWACLDHADEILVSVRGAFIASQAGEGISGYLSRRRG
ncbi:MAG: VOC family protein [Nocardiopsaceae bacterium]|jgi:predicted enzyme related to lactoylglutathione lyase|nr:VOC family protein [Nocardiopsaceae bacterium]